MNSAFFMARLKNSWAHSLGYHEIRFDKISEHDMLLGGGIYLGKKKA
jgi:hypothetical protein